MTRSAPLSLPLQFAPSGRRPLADDLYLYLQAAIRRGDLVPGQRLVEDAIADATAVSRTPVREALRRLLSSGLAVQGGRGLVVARLSSRDIREIFEVLQSLHVTAARLAAENRSDVDIAEMLHILGAESTHDASDGDRVQVNRRFRQSILRAAGNDYLANLVETMISQAEALVDFTPSRTRPEAAAAHTAIFEAIEHRDPDAAQTAMENYMRGNLTAMLIGHHDRAGDEFSL